MKRYSCCKGNLHQLFLFKNSTLSLVFLAVTKLIKKLNAILHTELLDHPANLSWFYWHPAYALYLLLP
jgi:hypothetical protein